jgi:two-component system sensor histidine kinase PilS (NtrC family)
MNMERKNILWLILVRLIIISSLLVSAVIIQFSASEFLPIIPFYYLILFAYFLSLFYFLGYLWKKNYVFQAALQIFFDLLLITTLVYISGGLTGSFYFLYVFAIIAAGIVLSRRAAYFIAALSAIFFGLLVDGMYFGIIPYFRPEQFRELSLGYVLFTMFMAWAIFFVIAFLINYLTGNLRITKEELRLAQKELEIKERLAAAGQISASIAHEIRNPLAAISGSVQVLKDELQLDSEQKNLMTIILKESERISQTIEQFLDLASPERQAFTSVNLPDLISDTLTLLQASGELNGNIRVEGNFEASGIHYYGNSNQFKQVFWNLTKNAIKAMPDGGTLTIDFLAPNRNELCLRFADTGVGMTEEDKARLFEPFYSGFENGRGLGMAVVRRIVDDYEGKIEVNSELDRGTEILITLPLRNRNKKKR